MKKGLVRRIFENKIVRKYQKMVVNHSLKSRYNGGVCSLKLAVGNNINIWKLYKNS